VRWTKPVAGQRVIKKRFALFPTEFYPYSDEGATVIWLEPYYIIKRYTTYSGWRFDGQFLTLEEAEQHLTEKDRYNDF
jgi:hypothetical protein